jgi:hypothetical protein
MLKEERRTKDKICANCQKKSTEFWNHTKVLVPVRTSD